jgi:Domain of unknown function (DUF4292)
LRKITCILIIYVICAGCSVGKKQTKSKELETIPEGAGNIYESIVNQNVTARNFFIEKADFKIVSGGGEESGIGTIKFMMPDKYLISIKSRTGIEIARIFLTEDSIMLNDRLNKKLYYGSASYLKSKYGLTTAILPVILGDCINDEIPDRDRLTCKEGKINLDAIIKDIRIKYVVDCKYGKSILTLPANGNNSNGLKIEYGKFFRSNGINIPGIIDISESQTNTRIEIKIQKIIFPWEGSLEFIPGKQYEKIHLL